VPRQRFASLLALLIGAVLIAGPAGADSTVDFERVAEAVETSMDAHGVPGVSVAIIDDFEVVWVGQFGFAEPGRPVGPDTLFQAASLTKPVSAVVAAAAAEAGLVNLEADALAMLTRWRHPKPWWEGPVTLRMLFAHRAGVNVHGFPGYRMDERVPDLTRLMDGIRDKNEPIRVVEQPGAQREYSGGGYLIAQLAVEDQTGIPFEDLAERLVFDPLGLELSTYRTLSGADRGGAAVGYRADGSEVAGGGWHQYPEMAAGSMWTTPTEYAAFVIDVMRSYELGSGMVLDRDTARLLLDPDFAVGFGIGREEGGIAIGHEGANEGYRGEFVALPHLGNGVIILTNSDEGLYLTAEVVDVVAEVLAWPWTGWSTPLWAVVLMFLALVLVVAAVVHRVCAQRCRRPATSQ